MTEQKAHDQLSSEMLFRVKEEGRREALNLVVKVFGEGCGGSVKIKLQFPGKENYPAGVIQELDRMRMDLAAASKREYLDYIASRISYCLYEHFRVPFETP